MYRQSAKIVKQQYLTHMSSQYGARCPCCEFVAPQQISTGFAYWLRYCTDVAQRRSTKLCTIFGRFLGWYTIYTFLCVLPLAEFCQVQISLCVQSLRSPILASLYGTRVVVVSQTLRHGTRNGITELLLLVIFNRERHLYSEAGHHVGHRPTF